MPATYFSEKETNAIPINSYTYSKGGNWILVKVPKMLLVFSRSEWVKALKRGKSTLRAHAHAKRQRRQ
jgi:hypothetical protein